MRDDAAHGDVAAYLTRLRLAGGERERVARALAEHPGMPAFAALHGELAHVAPPPAEPAFASLLARLALALGRKPQAADDAVVQHDVHGFPRLVTTPPMRRTSMVPRPWPARGEHDKATGDGKRKRWYFVANRRRLVLLALALAQTWLATALMGAVLPYHGQQPLEVAILVLFAILFTWVSLGFWTALAGFLVIVSGGDGYAISRTAARDAPIADDARTAIVMPIANENVPRVFAGLRATYESLARTGNLAHFDFFVLSDTGDPDTRVAEVTAWNELCTTLGAYGRLFYRWRQHRIKRKSGNIADFCRRWGSKYRYMIVLDADSVMSGECLTRLVQIAEANPDAGIVQTAPRAAGRDTLYARMQQFATRMYGPLFTAGLHYWQLGESHYWGHNAIIRVAPFIEYCALERLPGKGALSGEILSHDFVEAALMRRAGWGVWIAYDVPGSYEEMPPNLIDELKRDRRWCQGNLMNARLMLTRGLHPAHRVVFMTGVMAYLSAPLWFLFLVLSTAQLAIHTLVEPTYFTQPYQLFPRWPEWRPEWALSLVAGTALLLFLPKVLSIFMVTIPRVARYGGRGKLVLSVIGEVLMSMLLAPIRMLFHTRFVVMALLGRSVTWKSPPREDAQTSWGEAIQRHGLQTLFGVAWAIGVGWLNPSFLWWLAPVAGALIVSIPISVYTSRATLGVRARAAGLFLIPEETNPPPEIAATDRYNDEARATPGFVDAVVDPRINALVAALAVPRPGLPARVREERRALVERALAEGPDALTAREKSALLADPLALSLLHYRVWTVPRVHGAWPVAEQAA
ncbi:MAG: glucans biosynthesis glucosyltransferase MdoH [Burkholderiales bacterium]